ncbi:ferredoxin oxidoreductase [Denitratisoma sp. DHT3]|uniref:2-oxoacid:acceptor oxidoreductase subunit alpha n=1 Tax=Denitratisoma sp. DHT3 TaxID=1981880 RepID=UPI0011989711|nr:2-oxoacid:acceptor oxidoreductase subunit alpha [Denitratisoma sp. DHT3]QDX82363.1 ferredoxin oxidoreductase [Denitratisoma sp. DHT3]
MSTITQPLQRTNDFVVKFANVNGSGSASANSLFARSILRMGVPASARNIFPSNIQGLPTWYEVRVSGSGWLARRGGVDLMVAMNPQTWDRDVAEVEPGGYLFYDSTRFIPRGKFRDDITVLGLPLTEICNREFTSPRERQLFKNIMYLGALAALLGIDLTEIDKLIQEQYGSKQKLIDSNLKVLRLGHDAATESLPCPIGLRVERSDQVGKRIFIDGNTAAGLGCVYGGATVAGWYPITPSTSVIEAFTSYCKQLRHDPETGKANYAIVQAEDELASIGMVVGAGWNGARAFTATSGPGISLMQEFFGLAYFAEIPAMVVNVQRGGPSTGMPTRTQQSDVLACAYASHGDTKHVLLFPQDPHETFEYSALGLDLAERLQTPVFVMIDLDIGMNEWLVDPFEWDDSREYDRGKVMTAEELEAGKDFGRYLEVDGDGIPYRTLPGTHPKRGAYFTRGTTRDPYAKYSEVGSVYIGNMERLLKKFDTARTLVPAPVVQKARQRADFGVIYYGSTSEAMREALAQLEAQGLHVDAMRVRGFPFADEVYRFVEDHPVTFVVEQNRDAQLKTLLVTEGQLNPAQLVEVLHYDGTPITARFISREIAARMDAAKVTPIKKVAS